MIAFSHPNHANKRGQIMAKKFGTEVTMQWTEWRQYLSGVETVPFWPSESRPDVDPTTGATVQADSENGLQPELHGTLFKCMVHVVDHALTKYVQHQEVETGDVILDYIPPLVRVVDNGDVYLAGVSLTASEVYTKYHVDQANRDLSESYPLSGVAVYSTCTLESLNEDQSFVIDGVRYVQKPVGEALSKSWDAIVAGVKFSRPILLRRAT